MISISLENLSKTYKKGNIEINALKDINIELNSGKSIAVIGRSGSGKSTFLKLLGGLIPATSGTYKFNNKTIDLNNEKKISKFRKNEIGFIVQNYALIKDINVYKNIEIPLIYSGLSRSEREKNIDFILKQLNISKLKFKYPDEISGGEAQRVAIARALVANKNIILADEPTGALDEENEKVIVDILLNLKKLDKIVVVATHNIDIAKQCDKIIELSDGKIINFYK